jgi:formylglycine-generating enzyme required for sulfatase activity
MRSWLLACLALPLVAAACGAKTDPPPPMPPPRPAPSPTTAPVLPAPTASATVEEPPATPPEPPSRWAKCEAPPVGMACVPGGNAVIGSADIPREAPVHTVEVSTFYVDKYEVRNKDYEACEKAKVCPERVLPDSTFTGADQPAVPLQWPMAHAYCVWAGKRMLTEAEWEKVARGGEEARVYPWGKEPPTCDRGQFQGCAPGTTKNVGSFPAGPYGVFDMAGNGYEWVQDWGSECFGGCSNACGDACLGLDPQGPCSGAAQCKGNTTHILKGGSWFWPGDHGRGSHRRPEKPKSGVHRLSVRCASSTPQLALDPPLAISEPPAKPADPQPPTADQLTMFRAVTEDTDVFKIPLCSRPGEATHKCRDPWSYVTTNEGEQHLFAPYVKNIGGGYVGLGSDQAYTFIGFARSEWAWLFDYDPAVVRTHYILRAVILASATRDAFVAAFEEKNSKPTLDLIKKSLQDPVFPGGKALAKDEVDATESAFKTARGPLHDTYLAAFKSSKDFHWLKSDDAYKHVRLLYQQGRIVALKGNLLTTVAIPSIGAAAKKLGVKVNVYYTSNADDQWPLNQAYRDSLLSLPFGERGVMIHTTVPQNRGKKVHDWDYVVQDGHDVQRRLRHPGWDRIAWLNEEGRRVAPKLVTIGLPAKTPREEPPK